MRDRVYYFEVVRDIPYSLWHDRPDYNCVVKNDVLVTLLDSQGLTTRKRLCKFRWDDLPLPDSVVSYPHAAPSYHEFVEVYIPEEDDYVTVDPSWDAMLSPTFPVNEWDGQSDTDIAVNPIEVYSIDESQKIRESVSKMEDSNNNYDKFYYELNDYLDSLRQK